jgi:hypothetical protein
LQSEYEDCVLDCSVEPWPGNYRQCRAQTCGLTENQCGEYGVRTCEQACQKSVECGETTAGELNDCVADCETEPWPGNYIDCIATFCGATDGECGAFHGT